MSVSEIFEIPKFYYFESGNDFSGSKDDFSYKIANGDTMKCMTWHGRLCSMKAEIEHEAEFERTQEGFEAMIKWLEEQYKGE
ncbi:hypothetical protein [Ruminococcus flavefaciens]|uniref:Uncharacterized protein n=1 Tax=Ruminococcus flavefaciens 007c TaxID=1341157 RepID=W7UWA5_RUMFL|nr:hypothetical protein [Ruminococcus flavefaciens]EWM52612.1 hypothetical protein RF007C_01325 [Ruminococcus flavefaciens 007c]